MSRYRDVRRFDRSSSARIVGSGNGRIVPGLHRNGTVFETRLEVDELPDNGSGKLLFCARLIYATHASARHQDPRSFCVRVCVMGALARRLGTTDEFLGIAADGAASDAGGGGSGPRLSRQSQHKSLRITNVSETAEALVHCSSGALVGTFLEDLLQDCSSPPRKLEEARDGFYGAACAPLAAPCSPEPGNPPHHRPAHPAAAQRPPSAGAFRPPRLDGARRGPRRLHLRPVHAPAGGRGGRRRPRAPVRRRARARGALGALLNRRRGGRGGPVYDVPPVGPHDDRERPRGGARRRRHRRLARPPDPPRLPPERALAPLALAPGSPRPRRRPQLPASSRAPLLCGSCVPKNPRLAGSVPHPKPHSRRRSAAARSPASSRPGTRACPAGPRRPAAACRS